MCYVSSFVFCSVSGSEEVIGIELVQKGDKIRVRASEPSCEFTVKNG